MQSPVKVRTREPLGHAHGIDHDKRLIFTAHAGDLLGIRPERTRREHFIKAQDLYGYLMRCAANLASLERARERKATKAKRRESAGLKRAEKRLIHKTP